MLLVDEGCAAAVPLDWAHRVASLISLSLAGVDAHMRDLTVARLSLAGIAYDAARVSRSWNAVDAAQSGSNALFSSALVAWCSATAAVHIAADRAARFVIGGELAPIVFLSDGSAEGTLLERLTLAASHGATTRLGELLDNHAQSVRQAYAYRPTARYGQRSTVRRGPPALGGSAYRRSWDLTSYERSVLGPLLAEADTLLALFAFT